MENTANGIAVSTKLFLSVKNLMNDLHFSAHNKLVDFIIASIPMPPPNP